MIVCNPSEKQIEESIKIAEELKEWFTPEAIKNMRIDFEKNSLIVNTDKGKVDGFLCYTTYSGKTLLIWMGIARKAHRKGIGNSLLKWLEQETKKLNGICPKCGNPLIIGVEYRVEEIAKHPSDFKPEKPVHFHKILPLHELIVIFNDVGIASKTNWEVYNSLIDKFESELNILMHVKKEDLEELISHLKELKNGKSL